MQPKEQIGVGEWIIDTNDVLGKGSYGSVYVCHKEGNESKKYAAKKIPFSGNMKDTKKINNELSIFSKLQNAPYLVKMHNFKKTQNSVYIIMDYCEQGSLQQYIKKNGLPVDRAIDYMSKICIGYKALREKKILHRDLKPDNILIDQGIPKLTDFGLGRIFEDMEQLSGDQTKSLVGSEYYMAPELLEYVRDAYKHGRLLQNPHYSDKSDVWSMGMVFFYMLSNGMRPWQYGVTSGTTQNKPELYTECYLNEIKTKSVMLQQNWPLEAQHLLIRMLTVNEKERISWDQVFEHPLVNPAVIQQKNINLQQLQQQFQQDIQRYMSQYQGQYQQQPQQYSSQMNVGQQQQQQQQQIQHTNFVSVPTQNVHQNYMPKKMGDSVEMSMDDNMEDED